MTIPATRLTNTGNHFINGTYDEVTWGQVIDTSLVLSIDAGNTLSYPGTGNTWFDLSTSNNNVTLFNSPKFDKNVGGATALTFSTDASAAMGSGFPSNAPYGVIPETKVNIRQFGPNGFTVETWVYLFPGNSNFATVISDYTGNSQGTSSGYALKLVPVGNPAYPMVWEFRIYGAGTILSSPASVIKVGWQHVVATWSPGATNIYIDGVLVASTGGSQRYIPSTLSPGTAIGRGWGSMGNPDNLVGSIGVLKVYQRSLSISEIQQNYNALKSRYLLANSQGNSISRVIANNNTSSSNYATLYNSGYDEVTSMPVIDSSLKLYFANYSAIGNTWIDLSGNGNNGKILNALPTSANNGGVVFNGNLSYIQNVLSASLFINGDITISAWCCPSAGMIVSESTQYGLFIDWNGAGLRLRYWYWQGNPNWVNYFTDYGTVPGTYLNPKPVHVAVVNSFGPTGYRMPILYINGVAQRVTTDVGVVPQTNNGSSGSLTVGEYSIYRPYSPFIGYISNVMIYNRTLSADEIITNYNSLASNFGLTPAPKLISQRTSNTGATQIAGTFDETTGMPVVDPSLKIWLDAAQPASYPGTGSTWFDLSGNGNNGTLINNPVYSTENGGTFLFNGNTNRTNNYVSLGTPNIKIGDTDFTIELMAKAVSFSNGNFINGNNYGFMLWGGGPFNGGGFGIEMRAQSRTFEYTIANGGAGNRLSYAPLPVPNPNYFHLLLTQVRGGLATLYLNGVAVRTLNYPDITYTNLYQLRIGFGNDGYFNGNIPVFKVYTRALSVSEVSQNFNAIRGRYGI